MVTCEKKERETDGFALSYYHIFASCFVPSPPITQEGGNDCPVAQVTVETELLAAECREETNGHIVKLEVCKPLASGGGGNLWATSWTRCDSSAALL